MTKVLVTGGLGFIGLNFVLKYHNDYDITVIDKLTYASNDVSLLPSDVKFIHADIRSINKLNIDTDFNWIVHFAAESHVQNALTDATPFWESNVQGTYELSLFAIKHKIKFFHVSTDEVFGEWFSGDSTFDADPEFTEASPYKPNNMYSVSKATSDQIIRAQHRSYGLDYIITNCGNNYGSPQHDEKFMPRVLAAARNGTKVTLHAQGTPIRDWIHVEDHCSAIHAAMQGPINQTYVIGARDAHSIKEVCDMAGAEYVFADDRPGVDVGYKLDPAKLEQLGWKPAYRLKQWLKEELA